MSRTYGDRPPQIPNTYSPRTQHDPWAPYGTAGDWNASQAQRLNQFNADQRWQADSGFENAYGYVAPAYLSNANEDSVNQGLADMWSRGFASQKDYDARMGETNRKASQFNTVFPWVKDQFKGFGASFGSGAGGGGGPAIDANPIWNPAQTQQQVNAMRAQNDAAAAARTRSAQQGMSGRGFASQSPLMALLGVTAGNAAQAANSAGERDIRLNAAQANARHVQQGQALREQQYASRQQEGNQRLNSLVALLNGLG